LYQIAKSLGGTNRPAREPWLRAAQSIPLNVTEGDGKQRLKDKNRFFEIARGSALECAPVQGLVQVSRCAALRIVWNLYSNGVRGERSISRLERSYKCLNLTENLSQSPPPSSFDENFTSR